MSRTTATPRRRGPRTRRDPFRFESLEQRLALAASYSFIDQSGNVVTVATSKGTDALLAQSLSFTPKSAFASYLDAIQLSNQAFAGTNLTVTAKTANNQPATVAIGDVTSTFPLNAVTITGDVQSLSANTSKPETFAGSAIASLHVGTIGFTSVAATSSIHGTVGSLKLDGSDNGGTIKAYSIGKVSIGGSLIGTAAPDSGSIQCIGAITGPISIGGSLFGGSGSGSGSIRASAIGGVSIGGAIEYGGSVLSGSLVADKIGKVTVAEDVRGGTIAAMAGTIDGITIQGSLIGADGPAAGIVQAAGAIGPVVVGKSIVGGDGLSSGSILSNAGSIASVSVGGSVSGGKGPWSGSIRAQAGGVGAITVGTSMLGGVGESSGRVSAQGAIGPCKLGAHLAGGEGPYSGSITSSLGAILGVSVTGSMIHGNGNESGHVAAQTGLGKVWVGGDVSFAGITTTHGTITSVAIDGALEGFIVTDGLIGSLHVGGHFGSMSGFGEVEATYFGPVKIDGDMSNGSIRTIAPNGVGGSIDSITIGGSLRGGSIFRTGSIIAEGSIGTITIVGDIVGGAADQTAMISAKSIGDVFAKSLQGAKGELTGSITSKGNLGIVTISGGISGGAGKNSGAIQATGSIAGIKVGLYVAGGAGFGSASIRAGGVLKSLSVTGDVTGFGPDPVLITAGGGILSPGRKNPVVMPSIKITGALTRACILAGYSDQSLTVGKASARIGQITLGSLSASSVVAGVSNPGFPYFGDANDDTVTVVVPPAIASIKIVGSATGSADPNERFGLVATSFGKITLAGQSIPQPSTGFIQSIGDAVGGVKNLFIHRL